MERKIKLLRITTVPISLNILLKGQLAYVRSQGFEVITASADGPEVAELTEREGVAHHAIPLTRKITPVQDLVCLWKLILYIRKEKIQVVHSHTPKAGLLGMLAARICGVPYRFHTVAGMPLMESSGFKRKLLTWTERLTYMNATRVYPNSFRLMEFINQEILNHPTKFRVIGKGSSNGIDTTYFRPAEHVISKSDHFMQDLGFKKDDFILTFVGRIVSDKGINELVEAFLSIKADIKWPVKLLLVGPFEDDLNPVTAKTRASINDHPDIITTGFQSDIRPYLYMSDVFVFPSYREGFPNVILQACAMGVPCIATDINGCNEIITHQETGLLVPPKNASALLSAMHQMINDDNLRKRFSEKARELVEKNYSQQYVWEQIMIEYKSQLNV